MLASPFAAAKKKSVSPFAPADDPSEYCVTIDTILRLCAAACEEHGSADDVEPSLRNSVRVKHLLPTRLQNEKRCRYCGHTNRCICKLLGQPRLLRHRLWVWIHHGDLFRASNSGKLLAATCPGARLIVEGIPETEAALMELLARREPTTCVLYPCEGSRSTEEYLDYVQACEGASPGSQCPSLDIIVIDGTWSTVKSMVRRVPAGCNFVRVNLSLVKSLFTSRKQGGLREARGFTSTLEACAALLDELGEPRAVSETLRDSFKLNDDTSLLCRRGLSFQPYGSWLKLPSGDTVSIAERLGGYLD